MIGAALAAILSHWRRQPLQLATLLVGLALATALMAAVQAINAEARASYARAANTLGGSGLESLRNPVGPIDVTTYAALRRGGWLVSPVLEGRVAMGEARVRVRGIDPLTAPVGSLPEDAGAEDLSPLDLIRPPGIAYAAPDTIAVIEGAPSLPRLIAVPSLPPNTMLTDISTAERLLDRPGQISRLVLLADQPRQQAPLGEIAPGLIRQAPQTEAGIARLTDSFHLNLTAFGLLAFAVGLFIVHGAIGLAFEQRRPMFRTLRALGLPLAQLIALLLAELIALALIAGGAGIALGYVIAGQLLPDVAATLTGLYGADVPGVLEFRPAWATIALGVALAGTLIAAAHGLLQTRAMPLLASAQPRAWALQSNRVLRLQALAGLGLIGTGAISAWAYDGLIAGFVLLAGLLLGAALLLPALLTLALSIGSAWAKGPVLQWFWADTRQQLPGLSLALMALLLALATNIGVSTMVGSFRATFTGWLDQRLASELYVTARSEEEAEELRAFLAPRVDAILPIWNVELPLFDRPAELYGIVDHPTYRDSFPMLDALPDVWEQVHAGQGILINEQTARRAGLRPGDPIAIAEGWSLPLAGIYSDYGNPHGQAIVGIAELETRFPGLQRLRHGLRLPPENAADVTRALVEEFGLPEGAIVPQAELKAFSLQIFERTFAVTAALNVLTLSVAGFAILTALLTLSAIRLPQLAPVWALGLTRRGLGQLEILRALALAALTFVLALPVGLVLAWTLLAVVNVEAFGWRLPMQLFPADWLVLLALALLAALISAAWPVRRLTRTPPAEFLKVFANER